MDIEAPGKEEALVLNNEAQGIDPPIRIAIDKVEERDEGDEGAKLEKGGEEIELEKVGEIKEIKVLLAIFSVDGCCVSIRFLS